MQNKTISIPNIGVIFYWKILRCLSTVSSNKFIYSDSSAGNRNKIFFLIGFNQGDFHFLYYRNIITSKLLLRKAIIYLYDLLKSGAIG